LFVVFESLVIKFVEDILSDMAEWGVPQVMPQADGFGKVFVQVKGTG
jgi:hypothetical protein